MIILFIRIELALKNIKQNMCTCAIDSSYQYYAAAAFQK